MGEKRGARVTALLLTGIFAALTAACGSRQEPVSDSGAAESLPENYGEDREAAGSGAANKPTAEQLLNADFLLYNVDCAATEPTVFAEGQVCGLYQSVSDQAYAVDEDSGMTWGYRQADYMVRETDHLGEGPASSKWTMKEEDYPPGRIGDGVPL